MPGTPPEEGVQRPQLAPLDVKEQRLYSEPLPDGEVVTGEIEMPVVPSEAGVGTLARPSRIATRASGVRMEEIERHPRQSSGGLWNLSANAAWSSHSASSNSSTKPKEGKRGAH
ncbi:hypothetical protein ATANTOWER_028694 [Ataeniobius toweri]|uniref:Uncharacterized protein n=1 Tax=Ataeniobius toweri TaxID=208326 RepID=A0ABU7AWN7_9TELE|nr:hypothetical protein [Ataeniobius toweri]